MHTVVITAVVDDPDCAQQLANEAAATLERLAAGCFTMGDIADIMSLPYHCLGTSPRSIHESPITPQQAERLLATLQNGSTP